MLKKIQSPFVQFAVYIRKRERINIYNSYIFSADKNTFMIKYMKVDKTTLVSCPSAKLRTNIFKKLKQQFSEYVENVFMLVAITSKTISKKKGKIEAKKSI